METSVAMAVRPATSEEHLPLSPILAVLNPIAGRRRHGEFEAAIGLLRANHLDVVVRFTSGPGDAERFARAAAAQGFAMVIAAGGDGTVNEVVSGLADAPLPLAIFPLGTTNVLAAEIGMPRDAASFVKLLATTAPRPAWVGEITGRRFTVMVSVGFDAHVVARVDLRLKYHMGKCAYVAAALRQLLRDTPSRYEITIDGVQYMAAAAVIAKGRYYGGRFIVAPNARITAPCLQACLLGGRSRVAVLRYGVALAGGFLSQLPDVRIITCREVVISGGKSEPMQVDGDAVARLPAVVRVAPNPISLVMR